MLKHSRAFRNHMTSMYYSKKALSQVLFTGILSNEMWGIGIRMRLVCKSIWDWILDPACIYLLVYGLVDTIYIYFFLIFNFFQINFLPTDFHMAESRCSLSGRTVFSRRNQVTLSSTIIKPVLSNQVADANPYVQDNLRTDGAPPIIQVRF